MNHVFGKSINFTFSPLVNGQPTEAYSLTSSRLYSNRPSETQIENNDSGHIQEVVTWTGISGTDTSYLITFSGLTDSNPHSLNPYETYFIVTNFKFENDSPEVFALESINVFRPSAWTSRITIAPESLIAVENKFSAEFESTTQLQAHIDEAISLMMFKLKSLGYDRARLVNLDESLNKLVLNLALSSACKDLSNENNDRWWNKHLYYENKFDELFGSAKINYDTQGDGVTTPNEALSNGVVIIVR